MMMVMVMVMVEMMVTSMTFRWACRLRMIWTRTPPSRQSHLFLLLHRQHRVALSTGDEDSDAYDEKIDDDDNLTITNNAVHLAAWKNLGHHLSSSKIPTSSTFATLNERWAVAAAIQMAATYQNSRRNQKPAICYLKYIHTRLIILTLCFIAGYKMSFTDFPPSILVLMYPTYFMRIQPDSKVFLSLQIFPETFWQ